MISKTKIAAVMAATLICASPAAVFAEGADSPDGTIVIEEVSEAGGIRKGDSGERVNEKWGTKISSGYKVVFVGDAYLSNAEAKSVPDLTVPADKYGGDIILHKGADSIDGPASAITLRADNLSPVIVLAKTEKASGKISPSTGDSIHPLTIASLVVSIISLCTALVLRKKLK